MSLKERLEELLKQLRMADSLEIVPTIIKEAQNRNRSLLSLIIQMLEHEIKGRRRRATDNRLLRARLPETWTIQTFPYARQPTVDESFIRQLADLDFVRESANIAFIGDVGVGKSGLAIGLAREAILGGYTGLFIKVHELVDQLYASALDRSTARLMRRLAGIDVLVLDEVSNVTLNEEQAILFFKLVDARYHKKSTIFTCNLGFDDWSTFIPKKSIESPLKDRITDQCHVIRIEGPSLRSGPRDHPSRKTTAVDRR